LIMKISDLEIDVPLWIEQDIEIDDIEAILQGGCSSGAYMPAVTYKTALKTMNDHGDEILDYIENSGLEISGADLLGQGSWAGMACYIVSIAVELWASQTQNEIEAKHA